MNHLVTKTTYPWAFTTGTTIDLQGPGPKPFTITKATYTIHLAVHQPNGQTKLYTT